MKKLLALLLAIMMIAGVFAGCGQPTNTPTETPDATQTEQPSTPEETPAPTEAPATTGPDGREFADEQVYRTLYSAEVTTMNYLSSGQTYELAVGANVIDSLVENDPYGAIIPSAATEWSTSEDGLIWQFKIREGQYWYDADGNQKDPVTAHDWVAAARYLCNAEYDCSNFYLMDGWIVNAAEYFDYTSKKIAAVEKGTESGEEQNLVYDENGVIYEGLKLDDEGKPVSSWNAEKGVYEEWMEVPEVKAEDVGVVAVDDYTLEYHLVKARPYFLTALQFGTYWPAPASLLEEMGETYATDNYSMWFNGAYILSTYETNQKRIYTKNENNWDAEHIYIERIEQTYNTEAGTLEPEMFLRGEVDYAGIGSDIVADWLADPEKSQMISSSRIIGDYSYFMGFNFEPKFAAEYEPENWAIAVNNENFRKAIFHGLDRATATSARFPGDDPQLHLINTITPRGFATNDGKDFVTYGALAEFNSTESFNAELALQYKEAAVAELTEAGCKFPIIIPMNFNPSVTTWADECAVIEQQLEELLGADFIDIVSLSWSGQNFLRETRRAGNYAIQVLNWGADYMDPETWTDPFADENSYNFMYDTTEYNGINQNTKTEETKAINDEYFRLVEEAKAEVNDMDKRFELFAAAEAYYIEHAVVIPLYVSGGSYQATKLNGFEGQFAAMGQSTSRYKGQHVYKTAMTQDQFDEQYEAWKAAMGE